jgi:hypothetical protein
MKYVPGDAHKTIRFVVVTVAIVFSFIYISGWVRACVAEDRQILVQECPQRLKRCEKDCDRMRDRVVGAVNFSTPSQKVLFESCDATLRSCRDKFKALRDRALEAVDRNPTIRRAQ